MPESHNDSAVVVAEGIAGSVEAFARTYEPEGQGDRMQGYIFL